MNKFITAVLMCAVANMGFAGHNHNQGSEGIVKKTGNAAGDVVKGTGKAADNIVKGTGKAVGNMLKGI